MRPLEVRPSRQVLVGTAISPDIGEKGRWHRQKSMVANPEASSSRPPSRDPFLDTDPAFRGRISQGIANDWRKNCNDLEWVPGQARDDEAVVLPSVPQRQRVARFADRRAAMRDVKAGVSAPEPMPRGSDDGDWWLLCEGTVANPEASSSRPPSRDPFLDIETSFRGRRGLCLDNDSRNHGNDLEWVPGQARDDEAVITPPVRPRRSVTRTANRRAGIRCVKAGESRPANDVASRQAPSSSIPACQSAFEARCLESASRNA